MEQFIVERRLYQQLKATNGKDSNVRIHSLITKDLLQVVVEGLVRLEKMRDAVNSGVKTIQCCDGVDNVGKHALVDAKMGSMDSTPLEKALWELYADIVLLAMSDRTPFTANVLVELSRRIREREERRAAIAASASSVVGTPVAISPAVDSALSWLSAITPDVVSLSFTALKYLAKAGNKHKRLQAKTAQVYYYVGQHYLSTDRYTKALESLHRAQSFYKAVGTEECDEVFGMYSVSSTITLKDVRYSLGEVFLRMAHLKSNIVPTAKISMDHVVAMGDVRPLSPEEDSFYRQAVDHFSHCEAPERLASALLVYGGRQIAHIASCGQQEDAAKGRNIYSLLRRVCELDNQKTAALEWEVLRLCSSTAPYGALQRWAEDVHQQWGGASALSDEGASNKLLLAVHPLEYELQMALVSVSLLEVKRNVKSHKLFALARSCSAYLTNALNLTHEACADADDKVTRVLATWNAQCAHELTYRLTLPISIRCCRALLRTLPGDKGLGTRSTLHRLLEMEESARNVAGSKRGKAADVRKCECCYSALLEPLVETLKEMSGW
ncbi:hypothetical protein ERJ75_001327900 [Trypanosoma vivax]|nr:hypothetical protein ERJ75_001327900 [Trypanosoma vivax]